jgi:hypothetical protein
MLSSTFSLSLLTVKAILAQDDNGHMYSYHSESIPAVVWIIDALIIILMIASFWKIFAKAGQPGWASIIPIYNWIVWCRIAGRPAWWVLLLLLCFPIFFIILCIDLAKSFGKGAGFAVGLILLGIIFFPVLAFGSAQYLGPAAAGTVSPTPSV